MDSADLSTRQRAVSTAYAAAGFAAAAVVLYLGAGPNADTIPIGLALGFTGIIIVFAWIGGEVALDLTSEAASWLPLPHMRAILRTAPLGLAAIAVTLSGSWILLWSGSETVIFLPPVGFALWVRWRVRQASQV